MRKSAISAIILVFLTFSFSLAQEKLNEREFVEAVKTSFNQSFKGLGAYKSGKPEKSNINDQQVLRWNSTFTLYGAVQSAIVYFPDIDIAKHVNFYYAGKSAEEAQEFQKIIVDFLPSATSTNYTLEREYSWDFYANTEFVLDFNSTTFADVQKHPSLVTGLIEDNGMFWLVLNIVEPYFKK